jgi:hypothetical protein
MARMKICSPELLALSLAIAALTACAEKVSPASDIPDAESPGDACEAQPLDDFCEEASDCPDSFADALIAQCPANMAHTFRQPSSCGGDSILVRAGQGETTYHFNEDDRLVGVYVTSDLPLACPDQPSATPSAERAYGRVCMLSGSPAPACQTSCPLIECRSGAVLQARWPFAFEAAIGLPITACRNDECHTGMLVAPATEPPLGSGVGFTEPNGVERDRDEAGLVSVWFKGESGGGVHLELEWRPWSHADLHDGDRYRVTTEIAGETHVLIDHEIEYGRNELGSGACYQSCPFVDLDLRELDDTDGGV